MALLLEPPADIRSRFRSLEKKAHDGFIAEAVWASKTATVTIHPEGRLIEVTSPALWSEHEAPGAIRGKITEFTPSSRFRQMCALARVRRDAPLPIFLTLTYPYQWPSDWEEWKAHLDEFLSLLRKRYPKAAAMWKLEPQERDAPHFHFLIWGLKYVPWQWVAVHWACIIHGLNSRRMLRDYPCKGGGKVAASQFHAWVDEQDVSEIVKDSLKAGISIENVDTWHGVAYYAAKYLGKVCAHFENGGGRFWGIHNRKKMPFSKVEEVCVYMRVAVMLKRLVRRFMHSKGYKASKGWRIKLITDDMASWLRAAALCCEWTSPAPPPPF